MSFGFSPSDIVTVITIAVRAYRAWNSACGEYSDITVSLNEVRILLERIRDESQTDGSVLIRNERDADRLKGTIAGVRSTVVELNGIIERFKNLGEDRSRERNWHKLQRNWDRFRLGNTNLDTTRLKLSQHVTAITAYLQAAGLGSLTNIEHDLHALPELMQTTMNTLAAEMRAGRREGSIMTAYSGDDPHVWREFRRELIGAGFKGSEIRRFKPRIKHCLQQWVEEGHLEEEEPPTEDFTGNETDRDCSETLTDPAAVEPKSTALVQSAEVNGDFKTEQDHTEPESPRVWLATEDGTILRATDMGTDGLLTSRNTDTSQRSRRDNDLSAYATSPEVQSEESRSDFEDNPRNEDTQEDVVQVDNYSYPCLRLTKDNNCTRDRAYCTVISVVRSGDVRLFAELCHYPRSLLPLLFKHLPSNAVFRSLITPSTKSLITDHNGNISAVSGVTSKCERLGFVNGVEVFLSFSRKIFSGVDGPPPVTLESLLMMNTNILRLTGLSIQADALTTFATISNQYEVVKYVLPTRTQWGKSMFKLPADAQGPVFSIETGQDLKKSPRPCELRVVPSHKHEFTDLDDDHQIVITEILLETSIICFGRDFQWHLVDIQLFGKRLEEGQLVLKRVSSTSIKVRT